MNEKERRLSHEHLLEILDYDPETGLFTWKKQMSPKALKGSVAGTHDGDGYIVVRIYGYGYRAHRLAIFYMTGKWPVKITDHKNGVRDDNTFSNLREASFSENSRNQKKKVGRENCCKGVFWYATKQKWRTVLKLNGKTVTQRCFDNLEDAEKHVRQLRSELHGDFANHG